MYDHIEAIIHVGDHSQLRPTVQTLGHEDANPLAQQIYISQFERFSILKYHAVVLSMQHRATEPLMWFSSENCYFNDLENAPNTKLDHPSRKLSRQIQQFHKQQFGIENHWLLLNVKNSTLGLDGTSSYNQDFVLATLNYIRQFYQHFTDNQEMCIITPYAAQVKMYSKTIRALSRLSEWRPLRLDKIHLSTVDGVQGQEYDVVFVDLVKAGMDADIGFVRNLNRLNVSASRSKLVRVLQYILLLGDHG